MKEDEKAGSDKSEVMKALSAEMSTGDDHANVEISRMITELNEVRMRLDSVVRKIGATAGGEVLVDGRAYTVDKMRLELVDQLDRIREKLVQRSRAL
jgi:hypothetical protein